MKITDKITRDQLSNGGAPSDTLDWFGARFASGEDQCSVGLDATAHDSCPDDAQWLFGGCWVESSDECLG